MEYPTTPEAESAPLADPAAASTGMEFARRVLATAQAGKPLSVYGNGHLHDLSVEVSERGVLDDVQTARAALHLLNAKVLGTLEGIQPKPGDAKGLEALSRLLKTARENNEAIARVAVTQHTLQREQSGLVEVRRVIETGLELRQVAFDALRGALLILRKYMAKEQLVFAEGEIKSLAKSSETRIASALVKLDPSAQKP